MNATIKMTANDTIKTDIVIKSIQSLSILNFFIALIWPRGREVCMYVCHHCIICHVLTTYIDIFLQMNIRMNKGSQ